MALFFAVASVLACSRADGRPPFNPKAALDWCVATVVSPIPAARRIYVLGPDKTKEVYGLNGGLAYHDLETRLAVEWSEGTTIAEVLRFSPKYVGDYLVWLWRVSPDPTSDRANKALYIAPISEASESKIVLRPGDIIEISRPVQGPEL